MKAVLRAVQDVALLVGRLVAAVVLVAHGWDRWQVAGIDSQLAVLRDADLPLGFGIVVATIAFELVGGTLLAFGLGTRLIGLGMAALNSVIVFAIKWGNGLDHLFVRPPDDGSDLIADTDPGR